jgi:hypothetical protein
MELAGDAALLALTRNTAEHEELQLRQLDEWLASAVDVQKHKFNVLHERCSVGLATTQLLSSFFSERSKASREFARSVSHARTRTHTLSAIAHKNAQRIVCSSEAKPALC